MKGIPTLVKGETLSHQAIGWLPMGDGGWVDERVMEMGNKI